MENTSSCRKPITMNEEQKLPVQAEAKPETNAKKTRKSRQKAKKATADYDNRVRLCPDGKYRWIYEVPLLRNPSILFDVWKVLGISGVICLVIIVLIELLTGNFRLSMFSGLLTGVLGMAALFLVLSILGYLLYAAMTGWKYLVLFIMDEKEVVHKQMPKTVKKAQLLGKLTMLAGAAAGSPGVVGTGMLAKSRTSLSTDFDDVRRLIPRRRMNLIKVNERLFKNRVYVEDADFDFVYNYLCEHCKYARKG